MKGQKLRHIILTALTIVMLCFCVLGCSPEVTDNKKREEEEARRKEYELLEYKTSAKVSLDNLLITETTGKKERPHIVDYFSEIIERSKEEIDAAEDKDMVNVARSYAYRAIENKGYCYDQLKQLKGIHSFLGFFKVSGEYEDIRYGIELDWHSVGHDVSLCFTITSNNEDIEVDCIIDGECHWEEVWDLDTNKSIPISEEEKKDKTIKPGFSIVYKSDWCKVINHPGGETEWIYPKDVYLNFIVKHKGEIIGYTIVSDDASNVLRAVSFTKEDAKSMTKEKVRGYIEDTKAGINGESRDGIKTANNTVSVYYDVNGRLQYGAGKDQLIRTSDGTADIILTMPEESEDVEFIMHTDGAFITNGEEKKRIEIKPGEEVIYKNTTGKDEYVYAIIKHDGQIGYALFMYRKELAAFEFVNCKRFTIPEGEESFFEYRGFELDERFLRSYINEEIRQWREKNA